MPINCGGGQLLPQYYKVKVDKLLRMYKDTALLFSAVLD